MPRKSTPLSRLQQRKIAGDLFNHVWVLLEKKARSQEEDDEMLHTAHASCFHWGQTGTPLNRSVGEWQISRVYATLGRAEPAIYHARRSLEIARHHKLGRFYLAYAYEALARASAVVGDRPTRDRSLRQTQRIGARLRSRDDRRVLLEDLKTIP